MRLALAAVLAGCSAENATNATALLEAATRLRAEAAALETQAQAEANASKPTPAPTTHAPTPWIARPFRTHREDMPGVSLALLHYTADRHRRHC